MLSGAPTKRRDDRPQPSLLALRSSCQPRKQVFHGLQLALQVLCTVVIDAGCVPHEGRMPFAYVQDWALMPGKASIRAFRRQPMIRNNDVLRLPVCRRLVRMPGLNKPAISTIAVALFASQVGFQALFSLNLAMLPMAHILLWPVKMTWQALARAVFPQTFDCLLCLVASSFSSRE